MQAMQMRPDFFLTMQGAKQQLNLRVSQREHSNSIIRRQSCEPSEWAYAICLPGIARRGRQVGRVVATITGERVSAQTVSKLTRDLDEAVRQFHEARLSDDYVYLFLDGVSLRVRRPSGRKRVQMLVAYGIKADGQRHLLAFLRSLLCEC
jgi:mutator family transposase